MVMFQNIFALTRSPSNFSALWTKASGGGIVGDQPGANVEKFRYFEAIYQDNETAKLLSTYRQVHWPSEFFHSGCACLMHIRDERKAHPAQLRRLWRKSRWWPKN